jgi:hypothetical protein
VYLKKQQRGYNVGLGYNPFSENIIGTNNIGIGFGLGVIVLAVIIHFRNRQKRIMAGHIIIAQH